MDYAENYKNWQTLHEMFFSKATELGEKPLFWKKDKETWIPTTWKQADCQVRALARGLKSLGVSTGDRVVLVSENCPEWGISDLAIMAAGALTVPAYITNTTQDHAHIFSDSGATIVIVSNQQLAERVLQAATSIKEVKTVITLEKVQTDLEELKIINWYDLIDEFVQNSEDENIGLTIRSREDTACLIYTSGTGGNPKGVMLSHGAILCNCTGAHYLFNEDGLLSINNEVFLSFLPLSHSYEHTAGLHFAISIGAEIYYAEGIDRLANNMAEVKPTMMAAVPRLYEMMHQRITTGVTRKGGISAVLFNKTIELGSKKYEQGLDKLSLWEKIQNKALDRLVRAKVAKRFGGRLKSFISGGAPLNYDIGLFFTSLGVRISQGYGLTETAPIVSCNPFNRIKLDTVGPAVPGVEVKLEKDGELVVRGELIMQGYWGSPDLTNEILKEGWIYTGDIAEIDDDNYIKITDRKKDIIVNSGGDNISPQRVEGILNFAPEISQSLVYWDKRPHLVALLIPDQMFIEEWAKKHGHKEGNILLIESDPFKSHIKSVINKVNEQLSPIEQIRNFIMSIDEFSTENGLMTPTLKPKRHKIKELYGDKLEALYRTSIKQG